LIVWQILRVYLIAASIAAFFYGLKFVIRGSSDALWVDVLLMTSFVLNAAYLCFGVSNSKAPSRVGGLFNLWLDAKEAELRRRAGK